MPSSSSRKGKEPAAKRVKKAAVAFPEPAVKEALIKLTVDSKKDLNEIVERIQQGLVICGTSIKEQLELKNKGLELELRRQENEIKIATLKKDIAFAEAAAATAKSRLLELQGGDTGNMTVE